MTSLNDIVEGTAAPGESSCLDASELSAFLTAIPSSRSCECQRAVEHFGGSCGECWSNLETLAGDDSVTMDLTQMEQNARYHCGHPPIALVLARWVAMRRSAGEDAALPPLHRYLLHKLSPKKTNPFDFWWLIIEELNHLGSIDHGEQDVTKILDQIRELDLSVKVADLYDSRDRHGGQRQ